MMKIESAPLKNILLIMPDTFKDNRGSFMETYRKQWLKERGLEYDFVQDNISVSRKGTIRGLHYQMSPASQVKLVMVAHGEILDVAVDMRENSPTFGRHYSVKLSSNNRQMVLIPSGFAHGFSVLSDEATVYYKCNNYYNNDLERGVRWNDPDLAIDWLVISPILSEKDLELPYLADLDSKNLF